MAYCTPKRHVRDIARYELIRTLRRDGKTLKQIGVELDVSAERIRQMLKHIKRWDEREAGLR